MPTSEDGVLALLYAAGRRPSLNDVRGAGETSGAFTLTFDPGEDGDWVWAELLITGLTFELGGLAPGQGEPVPLVDHRFGLVPGWSSEGMDAVVLRPGPHLAGAAAMLPVVRGCVALASSLANQTGALAVVWIPARSAMATNYFEAVVEEWLGGGAFPALGLTALVQGAAGIESCGLAFFTGQEIEVVADFAGDPACAGRIAVRMVDLLVGQDPLVAPGLLTGPAGELLQAEPVGEGDRIRVRLRD
ncbi:MAG: hypothetical protein Q8R44_03615 [Novosphingobium sp.]|nr:hypothetical protein [Novosphingobium sp.]